MKQQSEAMKRMVAARTALVLGEPFWGTLTLKLKLREDPSCKTAWVDGKTLGFNPTYINSLPSHSRRVALTAHEVGHCVLGHPWRRAGREAGQWNEAADRALNPVLRDASFQLPDNVLYELEPSHVGKSAEWIYNRLQKPQPKEGEGEGDEDGSGDSDDESQPGGSGKGNGDGNEDQDEQQDDQDEQEQEEQEDPFGGEVRDAPAANGDDDTETPTEEDWKEAVQQAAALAEGQGKLPGGLARLAEQAARARVDWRSVLRRFVQEITNSDYSWEQPNRRYMPLGLYLPSLYSRELGPIVIGIDTSGSIDATLLALFGAEVQAVAEEMRPRRIHIMYCDAALQKEETFEQGEQVVLEAAGGGGTDFRPVFAALEGLDEPPACVLYLTDLYGTFPPAEQAPDVPVLWVTPTYHAQDRVPFGEVVSAEE
ncbi:hypothetical protein LCGC14_0768530 [marine sediment metagenome]|uniref:Metallopeptidase domain-containing protein n=1 Tax=marine sediment metagenome TaxID=412755 RepID=A0A0F9PZ30_9ZZZZ